MDTSKIIRGVVSNGRYTVTAPIVKEDYGLYLQIECVELPETYQVDFSNSESSGTSVTMIGNADGVLIPRQFIDTGKDVFAFLYHVGDNYGKTVYKFRIPNKVRPDRTNEEPTPEEQSVIDQAIGALNTAVAKTAQDVISADQSARSASDDADRAESARNAAQGYVSTVQGYANSAQTSASQASASATASAQSAQSAEQSAQDAQDALEEFTTPTASATTLPEGSNATASYADGHFTFGIPTGATGAKGDKGDKGDTGIGEKGDKGDKGDKGEQGDDYVLTEQDKQDIADIAEADLTPTILNAFPTDTASGSIASFTDGADNLPLKSLVVDIDPVQDLSQGDPSPENICPISGWTGMEIEHTGKNLFDASTLEQGGINNSNGQDYTSVADRQVRNRGYIGVAQGVTYTLKVSTTATLKGTYIYFYDINKTFMSLVQTVSARTDYTFTVPSNCKYIRFKYYSDASGISPSTITEIQLELGSTATSYEPYNGTLIPISWQTEAGIVYGCKLDVLMGVLTIEQIKQDASNGSLYTFQIYNSSINRAYVRMVDVGWAEPDVNGQIMINNLAFSSAQVAFNGYISPQGSFLIWLPKTITSKTDFIAWMEQNPVEIVYHLATPIEIQLDAHTLNSLLGVNNIFADTGDTEVEYRADPTLYIQRLTEPDADMIADSNIVSGQYFMVGNTLYKATANIANGGQINVGTNCTRVSLAQALNEINA